jgi:hypothetical protein
MLTLSTISTDDATAADGSNQANTSDTEVMMNAERQAFTKAERTAFGRAKRKEQKATMEATKAENMSVAHGFAQTFPGTPQYQEFVKYLADNSEGVTWNPQIRTSLPNLGDLIQTYANEQLVSNLHPCVAERVSDGICCFFLVG